MGLDRTRRGALDAGSQKLGELGPTSPVDKGSGRFHLENRGVGSGSLHLKSLWKKWAQCTLGEGLQSL